MANVERYQHAARELERFARLAVYEATADEAVANARALLRLCVGVRRKLERWPASASAVILKDSRRREITRQAPASVTVEPRSVALGV